MDNYVIQTQSLVYTCYTGFKGALVSYVGSELSMDQIAITSDKPNASVSTKTATDWDKKIEERKKQLQEAKGEC